MSFIRALFLTFFGHFAGSKAVRGGNGHYNEQCHPQTYN